MQDTLQIFTASSGKPSARIIFDDETVRHLHSTVKPEAEANYYEDVSFWGNIIIFTGVGLGYHLSEKIKEIPSSTMLIVIDYYDELLNHTISNIFSDFPNEIITVSALNADQELANLTSRINSVASPCIQTIKHPASFDIHKDFYENILAKVYVPVTHQTIGKKSHKKGLLLYGRFFLQEECRRALQEKTGEDPIIFNYEKIQSDLEYESQLQQIIQKEKPDFILSINMKGFDGSGILSSLSVHFSIPVVVWFVDDPYPILLSQSHYINNQMVACCWEKAYLPYLKKKGFTKVCYLPLATDPSLFSGSPETSPRTSLGFIGTSMGGSFLIDIRNKFLWSDSLVPLVEKASDNLLKNPQINIFTIIQKCMEETGITLPFSDDRNITWLCAFTIHTASMKKRKNVIGSLIPLNIETFGDPEGWKDLLGDSIKTNPDLDYTTQLCNSYRNIAINVNITSCQMRSAVNQRVFDIPMAGSFVISDRQKDLEELFEIGKEAVCYEDIMGLKDVIKFYTRNKTAQNEIIKAARIRIKKEHTYFNRITSILDLLNN